MHVDFFTQKRAPSMHLQAAAPTPKAATRTATKTPSKTPSKASLKAVEEAPVSPKPRKSTRTPRA